MMRISTADLWIFKELVGIDIEVDDKEELI